MRHHRASDFSCKSVLYYHVLVLSGADRSSTGPVVEMPSCRTMIYHHYGCSIVQKVSSRTLKHLDSFWADTTPIRIGPYASQNDWCAVAAACPADGGARVTVDPEARRGGWGAGPRKTFDNRGAFGAYCALRGSTLRTTVRPGEPHLHYSNPRYIKICQNALPASLRLRTPSCISHIHGPSEIRAPTPRDARAFPVLPMCHAVFDVDRILHARAAPPHARLFVFIVCASSP